MTTLEKIIRLIHEHLPNGNKYEDYFYEYQILWPNAEPLAKYDFFPTRAKLIIYKGICHEPQREAEYDIESYPYEDPEFPQNLITRIQELIAHKNVRYGYYYAASQHKPLIDAKN